ncbi:hypothetical protein [Flexithrix dorotheae]|uniref:hypothetical protein n=1 Tax=Flexithrix dorotheae TaxID=70993 RepID=UPI00036EC2E4|nr:hypothetical protein [Flexithrix dorotheae]
MKILSTFIILLLTTLISFGQDLYVVHVKGDIAVKNTNNPVKVGDMLSSSDELKFLDPAARAVVLDETGKRMVVGGEKVEKTADGEFISFVKDVILPLEGNIQLSTRGGDPMNILDFKNFFGSDKYVIIGDELVIGPNKEKFVLENGWTFIFRYETEDRPVNKIVAQKDDYLVLDKNRLYKTKGRIVEPEKTYPVDLIYFNTQTNENQNLVTFQPLFIPEETLLIELKSVANFLQNNNVMQGKALQEELYNFVLDVHGPTNKEIFLNWIDSKELITKR